MNVITDICKPICDLMDYKRCTKTVMDNIADPNIEFDQEGVSNYWHEYQNVHVKKIVEGKAGEEMMTSVFEKIKEEGRKRKYDCIIGLSGGVDSSYIAYLVKKMGMRPLAVHFDNGWNSEIAVANIQNIIADLGCDLFTLVVDWEEFRDLQLAYLKASVIDIEVITDHAIFATLYKLAAKHKIKYVISGNNAATESILPKAWIFNKIDSINIKDIHSRYGETPLKTYPLFSILKKKYYLNLKKLTFVEPLNLMTYNKENVKHVIQNEFGWKDYGGKHFESVFTRFYQAYILPKKFKVDKRKAHLSNLICSGQMTREEALKKLEEPIYDPKLEKVDKEFVLKKLKLSSDEFEEIMNLPVRSHLDFKTEQAIDVHFPILKPVKKVYRMVNK